MMPYETAEMKTNRSMETLIREMKSLPVGVVSVIDDYEKRIQTLVYKDGRRVTRSMNGSSTVKPSAQPSRTKPNTSRGTFSSITKDALKDTMRKTEKNITECYRKMAQLDVEMAHLYMRGKSIYAEQRSKEELLRQVVALRQLKQQCAALLG